jgi:hypothetical protein
MAVVGATSAGAGYGNLAVWLFGYCETGLWGLSHFSEIDKITNKP